MWKLLLGLQLLLLVWLCRAYTCRPACLSRCSALSLCVCVFPCVAPPFYNLSLLPVSVPLPPHPLTLPPLQAKELASEREQHPAFAAKSVKAARPALDPHAAVAGLPPIPSSEGAAGAGLLGGGASSRSAGVASATGSSGVEMTTPAKGAHPLTAGASRRSVGGAAASGRNLHLTNPAAEMPIAPPLSPTNELGMITGLATGAPRLHNEASDGGFSAPGRSGPQRASGIGGPASGASVTPSLIDIQAVTGDGSAGGSISFHGGGTSGGAPPSPALSPAEAEVRPLVSSMAGRTGPSSSASSSSGLHAAAHSILSGGAGAHPIASGSSSEGSRLSEFAGVTVKDE